MTFLDNLSVDNRQVLVRLPYRAGLLVSQSDASGGAAANEQELQALSNILHGFADELFGSEAIQHILSETIRRKEEWKDWGSALDRVPEECTMAMDILRQYGDEKDAKAFRTHLMEIAEAVAQAFREDEKFSAFAVFGMYVRYMLAAPQKGRRTKSFREFLNISAHEHKALAALQKALEVAA